MRKIFLSGTIFLNIALILSFQSGSRTSSTFQQAIKDKLITIDMHSRAQDEMNDDFSSHYGPCVSMTVKNISGKSLQLSMDKGQILNSDDPGAQDLIITQPLILAIEPAAEKVENLYAMCTQMSHWSPGKEDGFSFGPMAGEDLRKLTEIIYRYKIQNATGQDGVWVLTDAYPLNGISGDPGQVKLLKDYLRPLVGKKHKEDVTIHYKNKGSFEFRLMKDAKASMILYDRQGEEYQVYFRDKFFKRGIYTMDYNYSNELMKPGIYTLKLKIEGKAPKIKQFIVREEE